MSIHLRCTSVGEGSSRVVGTDLSRDDNTLLIAREGMLQKYKKTYSQFTFSITILFDFFNPIV